MSIDVNNISYNASCHAKHKIKINTMIINHKIYNWNVQDFNFYFEFNSAQYKINIFGAVLHNFLR